MFNVGYLALVTLDVNTGHAYSRRAIACSLCRGTGFGRAQLGVSVRPRRGERSEEAALARGPLRLLLADGALYVNHVQQQQLS